MKHQYSLLIGLYLISLFIGAIPQTITLIVAAIVLYNEWGFKVKNLISSNVLKWGIGGAILAIVTQYTGVNIQEQLFNITPGSTNTLDIVSYVLENPFAILIVVFVAPILEEVIFRKIIFGELKRKIGTLAAALTGSTLFSFIHFELENILVYIFIGLVFTFLYDKTKNIAVPIIAHVLMNTTVLSVFINNVR